MALVRFLLDHSSSGLFIYLKGLIQLRNYWYVSLAGNYPQRAMSVQIAKRYTIVELTDEATPVEVDHCKLVYCGCGRWKDAHIQENIRKYV